MASPNKRFCILTRRIFPVRIKASSWSADFKNGKQFAPNATVFFRVLAALTVIFCLMPQGNVRAGGTWSAALPFPSSGVPGVNNCILMSDGTVLGMNGAGQCVKLTPDIHGSYFNGTWTTLATMNNSRLFFSSQLLTNGNLWVAGGEDGTGGSSSEVYNPVGNSWSLVPPPANGYPGFSDSISEILPNGNPLVAPVSLGGGCLIYNVVSNNWQTAASAAYQDEASWVKLPSDCILTIDAFSQNSEHYVPSLNEWVPDGGVPVQLYDSNLGELGSGHLLPNGQVFYLGSTTNTAIYTPPSTVTGMGSWVAGPAMVFAGNSLGQPDAPSAMMVNGKILCCLGPSATYSGPCSFYEYDYSVNAFTQVNAPGGGTTYNGSAPFGTSMLDLPDGTVLFIGGQNSTSFYIYTPDGVPLAAGQPVINSITQNQNGSYHLAGTGLNGISEGATYGDDEQMNSNYPLIRMTNNATGNVYYARTYNWSSTSVMTSNRVLTTEFSVPQNLPAGIYSLVEVANGNASLPLTFTNAALAAPTGLAGTAGNAQAILSWNSIPGATAYNVKQLTTTTPAYYTTVATVSGTSCTNFGLVNGTSYFYSVSDVSPGGESSNSPAIFLTPSGPPPVPINVTAAPDTFARIDLAWSASSGAVSYNIKRSNVHSGPFTNLAMSVNPFYTDTGLANGNTYYYEISAVNGSGESSNSIPASTMAQSIVNFGFEVPNIGSGNYQYVPTNGFWTFSGTNGNGSGIVANGSGFSNPSAPEGTQAAFVQSNGVISQVFAGFVPGMTYTIIYSAAQRGGASQHGGESWNVMIDNTVIQSNSPGSTSYTDYSTTFVATAALHTLSFVGTDLAGGDNTVFLDNVQITIAPPAVSNFSFEVPSISNYQYNPAGGTWTFTGSSPNGSGLVANGGGFSNPNAPLGVQAAFVQELGTVSQTISGFTPGVAYTLTYSAAQRSTTSQNGGESWKVLIDTKVIQTNGPGGTSFADYSATFVATAVSHKLTFAGTDLAGGDNTVFLDDVSITSPPQPIAPVVTLTTPTNNILVTAPTTVALAAAVATNGNVINNVKFYDNATNLIGQASNPAYTYNWSAPNAGVYRVFARVTYNGGSVMDSPAASVTVVNGSVNFGFETPAVGAGNYQYNPAGGSWIFGGASGNGSGLVANGSGFANPNAPQGSQAAFIQSYGSVAQTLAGFTPGVTYTISFSAAQRGGTAQHGGESWNVMIDNTVITNFNVGGTNYASYAAAFTATATVHTLSFVGTDTATGDNTVFLDNVRIVPPIPPVAPAVVLTAPANNAAFLAPATVNLAATVTSNSNLINGVNFYFNSTNLIVQVTNPPYFYSWNNVGAGSYGVVAQVVYNNSSSVSSPSAPITVTNPSPPLAPTGLTALTTNTQVMLSWTASATASSYNLKFSTTNGGAYLLLTNLAATSYTNSGLLGGVTYYYVVSALNLGGESPDSAQASATPEALPPPWLTGDIGSVGLAGNASFSNGVFALAGSGSDIAGAADAFRFVYQAVDGNCDIRAQVTSIQNTSPGAKAGVMIRETLAPDSANALTDLTPNNGLEFIWRPAAGATSGATNIPNLNVPYWVRLVRNKNTFTSYASVDGTNWAKAGASQTIAMATNAYVGLVVCSQNNTALAAAAYDNVTLPTPPAAIYAPLQLAGGVQSNGVFVLQFRGVSDLNYTVETSTNLAGWTPVYTNALIDSDGGLFIFTNASLDPVRFYQVTR